LPLPYEGRGQHSADEIGLALLFGRNKNLQMPPNRVAFLLSTLDKISKTIGVLRAKNTGGNPADF
jgi:hypothetical protein